jgi:hypothetical protein
MYTIPIRLGYVIVGHKTQGAIISNKVIVKIQNAFALGFAHVVVMNKKLQTLIYICGNLTPKISLVRFKSYFQKYKSYNHILC